MPQFTVPLAGGGSMTVNASDPQAAVDNVRAEGGTPASDAGGGTPNTGSAPGVGPQGNIPNFGGDLSGLAAFGAQTSGVTQKQLDQQKAEFDAQLQFARDQMQQLGIPQLQINQALALMQQWQFQSQLAQVNAAMTGYWTPPQFSNKLGSLAGGTGGGAAAAAGLGLQAGTVVRTNGNQFGVVNSDGSIAPQNDSNWPTIYGAIQAGSGIQTVTDAQWAQGTAPGAGAGGGGTPQGVPTLAAQAQWAQLYGQNAPPTTGQQTLAAIAQAAALSGMYQGMPTEAAREFNANLAQQYLSTAAQLQGPQNTFQLSNYLRGAQGNPNVPAYIQALAAGTGLPAFAAPGSTPPTPQSATGLLSQLGGTGGGAAQNQTMGPTFSPNAPAAQTAGGGGAQTAQTAQTAGGAPTLSFAGGAQNAPILGGRSATPGWNYNQTLGAIGQIMSQGAQALGPGSLERLSPDELAAFGSGLGQLGGSLPAFMQAYAQSRLGQQAPVPMMALG